MLCSGPCHWRGTATKRVRMHKWRKVKFLCFHVKIDFMQISGARSISFHVNSFFHVCKCATYMTLHGCIQWDIDSVFEPIYTHSNCCVLPGTTQWRQNHRMVMHSHEHTKHTHTHTHMWFIFIYRPTPVFSFDI